MAEHRELRSRASQRDRIGQNLSRSVIMFIPDSIEILFTDPQDNQLKNVDLLRTGIAWESDKKYKFKNPELGGKTLKEGWLAFVSLLS